MKVRCTVLLVLLLLATPHVCWPATYEWTDDKGTANFTEDYGSIPEKYRAGAKKRTEEMREGREGNGRTPTEATTKP